MVDWAALLESLSIPHWTAGKNVAKDNVNIQCPCPGCDDHSNHGGFSITRGSYRCWKCHGAPPSQVLAWAAHIPATEASKLIQSYTYDAGAPLPTLSKSASIAPTFGLPGGNLHKLHTQYLKGRGLDPEFLVRYYGVRGTMFGEKWYDSDYSLRLIIPVKDPQGAVVSFQGRDVTGDPSRIRYKACPNDKARMNYKHLLYGADLAWNKKSVVVVEGVFDAWKLGPGSVATFGTGMTEEQIVMLSHWEHVTFFFDPEPTAQAHAAEYAEKVAMLGSDVEVAFEDFGTLPNGDKRDLGDLAPHEITKIRCELGL